MQDVAARPKLNLIGKTDLRIWGLPLSEWQERAFKKAGVAQTKDAESTVHFSVDWVLSSALAKAFVSAGEVALVADDKIIGVNGVDANTAQNLIGKNICCRT